MNHLVNQTGILWFLICLPLISWVACRDLIWDCLPFLYGSVEGQYGKWWARAGTFSCCGTRSCTTKRKVGNPHLFSSLLFYSTLFWASFPRLLPLVFPPPILHFNYFHPACHGGCEGRERGWEVVACRHQAIDWSSSKTVTLSSCWRCCRWAGQPCGRTGVCQHLAGPPWCLGPTGTPLGPEWTRFLPLLLWLQPAAEGQSWGAGGNDISSTADVCSVDVSQSNFQALCYLSGSSLISPFCPSCRWGVSLEHYVPPVRCH